MTLATPLPPATTRIRSTALDPAACTARLHGTVHAHRHLGCTCEDAVRLTQRTRAHHYGGIAVERHVEAAGTRRRLQALAVIGYSTPALGWHLGWSFQQVAKLQQPGGRTRVNRATAERVAALYELLSGRPAGMGPHLSAVYPNRQVQAEAAAKTTTAALRAGYVGPLAWEDVDLDDPDAVPDRTGVLVPGRATRDVHAADFLEMLDQRAEPARFRAAWADVPSAHRPAVVAALSTWDRRGAKLTAQQIATLLGVNPRTVLRYKARAAAA